jgi:hypothetical protein
MTIVSFVVMDPSRAVHNSTRAPQSTELGHMPGLSMQPPSSALLYVVIWLD